MIVRRFRFLSAAALLGALCAVTAVAENEIASQTLRYAVTYQNINAGALVIQIRADDDEYVITASSEPSILARMFVRDQMSITRFARREQVELASGVERAKDSERRFRIDRARGVIEFHDGDGARTIPIAADDRIIATAFPLHLMAHPRDQLDRLEGARVREVSARRVRDYIYEAPAREAIETPDGRVDAWRIRRHRADRRADRVTVWLRADDAVPVKIRIDKRGKSSVLSLIEQRVDDSAVATQ